MTAIHTPIRPTPVDTNPITATELTTIVHDVLHGMQYSFLAAATNQGAPFPSDSVEESLRRAIVARQPAQRAAYQARAQAIAAQAPAALQATFGRFGALSVQDYAGLGLARSGSRLAPLASDASALKWAVEQLVAANGPARAPVANVLAGPGPTAVVRQHALHRLQSGAPAVQSVSFCITQVRCVDETDPEIGHDEISMGGLVIDESGVVTKVAPFSVSEYFLEDAGVAVYPDVGHDVSVVNFSSPGHRLFTFDTTGATPWPKSFAAVLTLAEIDDGGFADFLNDAWQKASAKIKEMITQGLAAAGAALGDIGAIIGKLLGMALAWLVNAFVGWIIDAFQDDISAPGTALISLGTEQGATYFNSHGWHDFATPDGVFDFHWAGGEYTVRCHWQADVPGYLQDNQPFGGQYIGVFRAGTDAHALWVGDWSSFAAKWQELSNANLRLLSIETHLDGNTRMYDGVFRAGTDAHALWVGDDWAGFEAMWEKLSGQGLRLVDMQTYVDGGVRRYSGVFRAGTDGYALWVGMDWASFTAKWEAESQRGLRLVSISSYSEGGKQLFDGVFRAGNDGYALWVSNWAGFVAKWQELSQAGLRLVDIETYIANGERMFVGVYRAGADGYLLWDADWNSFIAKWKEASQGGLRLIDVACY